MILAILRYIVEFDIQVQAHSSHHKYFCLKKDKCVFFQMAECSLSLACTIHEFKTSFKCHANYTKHHCHINRVKGLF